MNKFRFELNTSGVGELLHSKEMREVLMDHARSMAGRAGEGYEAKQMPTRVIAVQTKTKAAEKDNLKNNTLLKAVRK